MDRRTLNAPTHSEGQAAVPNTGLNKTPRKKATRTERLELRLTVSEKATILLTAESIGMDASEYIRRVLSNVAITTKYDYELMDKLTHVHADQARLGNLLKLAIDQVADSPSPSLYRQIGELLQSISDNQNAIKSIIAEF